MNHTPHWRKSNYSGGEGGSCIEVAGLWRKSSYSSGEGGSCIEVADLTPAVGVRDSKDKRADAPILTLTTAQFGDLLKAVKAL